MDLLNNFLAHFDVVTLIDWGIHAAAVLLCIIVHEMSHGFAAYLLGDPTARRAGRLSLNPLKHIDLMGLLMMLVVHVGWAKPVPVDMFRFKRPKRDMALTALAGPVSNFLLAAAALWLANLALTPDFSYAGDLLQYIVAGLCWTAVLSVGLGLFNLIPIPPLDGSRLVLAVLPNQLYYGYLRYERYLIILVVALAWFGFFSGPLIICIGWVLKSLCAVTGFPFVILQSWFGLY